MGVLYHSVVLPMNVKKFQTLKTKAMKRNNLQISISVIVFLIVLPFSMTACKRETETNPTVTSIPDFIKNNPSRSSFFLMRNDSLKISLRADQKFPLASTMKIMIAIEFAKQVSTGKINANELISVADLDVYYLAGTDGNAHPEWKQDAQSRGELNNNRVTLQEVAKGMIGFSSNANTEFLTDKLGLDNINANLTALNLSNHDRLYPIVSSLFLYSTNNLTETMSKINQMSAQQYEGECAIIHAKLKADKDGSYKKQFIFPNLELQKIWSNHLTASTTKEYGMVMQKILNQNYYPPLVQKQLDIILQPILESAANKAIYQNFYGKGGSTAFVLTYALGTKTVKNNKTVMAVFFNDLTPDEQKQLSGLLNTFLQYCTQGDKYKELISGL